MKTAENILSFLTQVCLNNSREWMAGNKDMYSTAKADIEALSGYLVAELGKTDARIASLAPKDTTYRIYRDTRFSADKTPLKNHMGIYIVPGGKNADAAGCYLHLEPDNCFVSGGIYMPQPPVLALIRKRIYENPDEYLRILNSGEFAANFVLEQGGELKTAPKGYPKDWEHIGLIKKKHYCATKKLSMEEALSETMPGSVLVLFKKLAAFNTFLNTAIGLE
jgi:uncharacterized protein (TIGR02453 family)